MGGGCSDRSSLGNRKRQRGVSLVEALIVVSIGLILMGVTVPLLTGAVRRYTVSTAANNVSRMVGVARFTGISQGSASCTLFVGNQFGVDRNCSNALEFTETRVQIPAGVTLSPTLPPGVTWNGIPFSPLPTELPTSCTTYVIAFNPRGSKTTVCGTATAGAIVNGFFLTGWGNTTAVTITGAGRARSWRFIGGAWQ